MVKGCVDSSFYNLNLRISMNSGRRDFFKVVGTAAAAAAAASPILKPAESTAAILTKGGYSSSFYALYLGGAYAGLVRSFDGGDAVGVLVKEPVDEYGVVRKHIATTHYEDIVLSYTGKMPTVLYEWIRVFLARDPALRSGSIISFINKGKAQSQLNFTSARISEVVFPELNLASKAAEFISVRLTPESTQSVSPSLPPPLAMEIEKAWQVTNFRVVLGTIDMATASRIRKIDAITIKQEAAPATAFATATIDVEPLDVGPIVLTIAEQFAKPFDEWHRKTLTDGPSAEETYLIIEALSGDKKPIVLYSLQFGGVGIVRVTRQSDNGRAEIARNVEVELYAETVNFYQGSVPTS